MSDLTTSSTITFSASADYMQSGHYIARIVGRHTKFTFEREFLGSRRGKRNEYCEAEVDDVGLYELRNATRKGKVDRYRLVLPAVNVAAAEAVASDAEQEGRLELGAEVRAAAEGLVEVRVDRSEAMALAKRLDKGERLEEIVRILNLRENEIEILTAAQAKRAAAAATVDEAVSACAAILAALPAPEAKRVLSALRKQIAPAAPKASGQGR